MAASKPRQPRRAGKAITHSHRRAGPTLVHDTHTGDRLKTLALAPINTQR